MKQLYKKYPWIKLKRYVHIGLPLTAIEARAYCAKILDSRWVVKYGFMPLIRFDITTFPYKNRPYKKPHTKKPLSVNPVNPISKKRRTPKIRSLMYASHVDSLIYSYYAYQLTEYYEKYLKENDLSTCITAYRRIPISSKTDVSNKCNIHFANDVFLEIKKRTLSNDSLAVMTFDIKGFFDNLDHKLLKKSWIKVMNQNSLEKDQYHVFKNVTRYAYVLKEDLFKLFHNKIICKKKHECTRLKKIKKSRYLRDNDAVAYCKVTDIKTIRNNHLIKTRKYDEPKGIPQGLPISAILANVYLMDFDLAVNKFLKERGGFYNRYSDDIIVLCKSKFGDEVEKFILAEIQTVKLEIQPQKVNAFKFFRQNGNLCCLYKDHDNNWTSNKVLEYLGFSFDGKKVLLKNSGLGKYYFKMLKSFNRGIVYASSSAGPYKFKLFKTRLIKRFTTLGARKHYSSNKKTYGNYLSYVKKSEIIIQEDAIIQQLRRNKSKFLMQMKRAESAIEKNKIRYDKSVKF